MIADTFNGDSLIPSADPSAAQPSQRGQALPDALKSLLERLGSQMLPEESQMLRETLDRLQRQNGGMVNPTPSIPVRVNLDAL